MVSVCLSVVPNGGGRGFGYLKIPVRKNHNNIKTGTICAAVTKPAKRVHRPLFVTLGTPRKKQRG